MIKLYQGGMSGRQVGLRFNVTISNVAYHLTKAGVWPGGKRIKPVADRFYMNTPPKFWHWPDHVAGKRETRRLREEHNVAMNSRAELLEACHAALNGIGGDEPSQAEALKIVRAAIAKTEETKP